MKSDKVIGEVFNGEALAQKGLLLQAVFDISQLPLTLSSFLQPRPHYSKYNQALLIGNAGPQLWSEFKQFLSSENTPKGSKDFPDPFDHFSAKLIEEHLEQTYPSLKYARLFPVFNEERNLPVGLQQLGMLAGWHHESPFKVGINSIYGSWFAYRGFYLIEGGFKPTAKLEADSPCINCETKPCIQACAGNALEQGTLDLPSCLNYRRQDTSRCELTCEARLACPVRLEYRYSQQQINYHYGQSIKLLKAQPPTLDE
jgi:epoxyqueuosine reductase